jgi:hypothetical protein
MRAAIVEREHLPILMHEQHRAMTAVHHQPASGFHLLEVAGIDQI